MARPLRADAARNRGRLLAAATAVLGEQGLDAPLEEVARRAGVGIGTVYNHFPDRAALVRAVSRIVQEAPDDPSAWRRFPSIHLDGLRVHPA